MTTTTLIVIIIAQKMKFSIKGFFSKCDQICGKLRIWSHLIKKSLMGNFIFCAVDNNDNNGNQWFNVTDRHIGWVVHLRD